jgi:hypothetical protein
MAEQEEASASADEGLDARVSSLETGQQSLSEKVDQILGIVSGKGGEAETRAEETAGGAPNIAHEIRQQLEERDAKARAAADEQAKTDRLAAAEAKIAELAEKPPEAMPRRVEKIMGWR